MESGTNIDYACEGKMMSRHFNLALTVTAVANCASQMALGRHAFAVISGILGLLSFAVWVARAPQHKG